MAYSCDKVFEFFREICAIPHGTYHIEEISDYLAEFARSRDLRFIQDELKNVIIFKDATPGYENEPAVILQGHMDMVAVSDDSNKDMLKEGLDVAEEGGYLFAKNTSLGGDDGIALAYALTILDADDIRHPALEAVFTVNEEVGMDGALGIDLSKLKAKRLLNIDSEEEGVITVSCAGGIRLHAELSGETENVTAPCVFLSLDGLLGGHSGTEIHKMRANGAHLLAEVISEIMDEYDVRLISMAAGEKDNAIPASGSAEFLICDLGDPDEFMQYVEEIESECIADYEGIENGISITVGIQLPQECNCLSEEDSERFIDYILEVPDGSDPRYAAFHPEKPLFYVNNEQTSKLYTVTIQKKTGRMKLLAETELMDQPLIGMASDTVISPDGKYVYTALRMADMISVCSLDAKGIPHLSECVPSGGSNARGMAFSKDGRFLYVCNTESDVITVFRVQTDGKLKKGREIRVSRPANLCFL